MTINLWICVPVQMDFLTTKILVKTTYQWFCEDNILVAFVYVRHQPQKGRKAELESRFRGEGGSGGWSWSKQSTSWPPVLDLYFLYFCISSPVLDVYFLFSYISFPVLDLYCLYLSISSLVLDMYFNTFVFLFPVLDLYLLVLLHFLFQGQPQNMSHMCDACCLYIVDWSPFEVGLYPFRAILFLWKYLKEICLCGNFTISEKDFWRMSLKNFFHTQLYWSVQDSLSKLNFIHSRLRQIEAWVNQNFYFDFSRSENLV